MYSYFIYEKQIQETVHPDDQVLASRAVASWEYLCGIAEDLDIPLDELTPERIIAWIMAQREKKDHAA
ncbi:hypothetical protein [Anthocerotibacter panamensis]|uniref:hypothetical protein n=1 Tax=Anthocerotibacter panamensis TaxID=2857077 RepID=UPI001C404C23|nr:hypothetical protein [Anthocerotibacter panamensis]